MSDLTVAQARDVILGKIVGTGHKTAEINADLDALLLAHRSALAGETEQETLEKAVDHLVAQMGDDPSLATSTVYQLAPILRAPLLLQLQDKNERIKALEAQLRVSP